MKKKSTIPWWVSALLAILSYYALKYLVPQLLPGTFASFAPKLAPLTAMAFLLHSGALLYEGDTKSEENDDEWDENGDDEEKKI